MRVVTFGHHFFIMSIISITKLYALLVPKLGRETSENLTTFIEEKIKSEMESQLSFFATKEDLARVEGRLLEKIANAESHLVKWMFIFWVSQVIATFGFILLFLSK
ncbi:MAG TPA: hypothetical protein VHM26_14060 [Chitinophagaceae bacterium]|nr:hypothetical protein [Chitinophagaceae bacterium]